MVNKIKSQVIQRSREIAEIESRKTGKTYEQCIGMAIDKACDELGITSQDYIKIFT